jgi:hypothetical protein
MSFDVLSPSAFADAELSAYANVREFPRVAKPNNCFGIYFEA